MNYLKEVIAFGERAAIEALSAGQISLWHALMMINNKCGFKEWFTAANKSIEYYSGLSRTAIKKNREVLKSLGIIDYKFNGMDATEYKMIPQALFDNKSVQGSVQESVRGSVQEGVQGSDLLYKQNKTKENKIYYNNKPKKSKFNNYEDTNVTDFAALEEIILANMLGEDI